MLAGPDGLYARCHAQCDPPRARPNNILPVSQGTRCHQLAIYTVFEGLRCRCSPTTRWLYPAKSRNAPTGSLPLPTSFDETVALDDASEYVVLARRKGALVHRGHDHGLPATFRSIFSFPRCGEFQAELFADGVNADRDATDYRHTVKPVQGGSTLNLHLARRRRHPDFQTLKQSSMKYHW